MKRGRKPRLTIEADALTVSRILAEICSRFSVTQDDLLGHCRAWKLVYPRWLAISLIRSKTSLTLGAIGALFNGDQSKVTYSISGLHDELSYNTNAKHDWESLSELFQ